MSGKDIIAIIGSREPTEYQCQEVMRIIDTLDKATQRVVSGCAYGIDALALEEASDRGFETVGILPWYSYNQDIQKFCTSVWVISDFPKEQRDKAYQSVQDHHPNPSALSQGAFKLHARNHGIVAYAKQVIACPSSKPGGGGTGQGIRLAQSLNIPITIIKP